jgi:hypothetical protein
MRKIFFSFLSVYIIISIALLPFTRIVSGRACPGGLKTPAKLRAGGV